MYLPYFGQDLESKKKVVGILAHVWLELTITATTMEEKFRSRLNERTVKTFKGLDGNCCFFFLPRILLM